MKRYLGAAAAVVFALCTTGAAFAQHDDHHDGDRAGDHGGGHSEWRKGGHLEQSDWARGQRVDWRGHHLRQPPEGYEWRQVDGNYVLAAIAGGVIADIILNSH